MIHFVGAGPGAADLITVRGQRLLREADLVIYAGSLVNPALLEETRTGCSCYDSSRMTLEDVIGIMKEAWQEKKELVRLHTGDPSLYGAIREQMDRLDALGIPYDTCPGVSSFCGAASVLNLEYTIPEISQSVIITRMEGRTPVPPRESIQSFASHQATMVIFLSTGMLPELTRRLQEGGFAPDTPAAIVYKATWEDEKIIRTTVAELTKAAEKNQVTRMALIIVGQVLCPASAKRSRLYDPSFSTMFRRSSED